MTRQLMRKGAFAKMINVTPGRVSQYIKARQIDGAAIVGTGRAAMLDPAVAIKQLQLRLDDTQMATMNGLNTKLDHVFAPPADDDDEVERPRGTLVDLVDVESLIDLTWVRTDVTVQEALEPFPEALAAYMAIRPELASIKDRRA